MTSRSTFHSVAQFAACFVECYPIKKGGEAGKAFPTIATRN